MISETRELGRLSRGELMRKTFIVLLFLAVFSAGGSAVAAEVYLGEHIMVELGDPDFTVQSFPTFGIEEQKLALWNGEQLVGLVSFVGHYKSSKSLPDYYEQFIAELGEGATDVRFRELRAFEAARGFEISTYHGFYREDGQEIESLLYLYPSGDGFQVVMCMILSGANYKAVEARMNAILETAQPL